jgi:hypothetical protein
MEGSGPGVIDDTCFIFLVYFFGCLRLTRTGRNMQKHRPVLCHFVFGTVE